jgi:DNA-binding GntR family transcriptional regulator
VEELMALSLDTECEVVSPLQRKVDVETASRLRLPSDEICHVTLVRRHAGTPFCYTSVYLPPRIGQLLAGTDELAEAGRRSRVTIIGLIDARLAETDPPSTGQRRDGQHGAVATAEQSVSAAGAPAFAAPHLGCDVGEPLLRIDRLYFDAEDAPVELAVSYFDPEHYSYRVRLRRRSR